ncbi:hypothetical protein O2W18_03455 [Modestobacter sp. VKM Ac-2983]|uniref:hypothetical protein n=1 Tax=Modestobacter sp. VKM Ac-2983 TaxID=3004137 RepID=UPI0022ABA1C7|nr:hypothetical protein [Modestobacter sp. VKM Ac-2983]MCZ2804152.1 hypothetical protein [Modestobacter sp. VKM Ac-2983]
MIGPFRRDVVVTGFVLAIPVFLLGLRGDFSFDDVTVRLLWCLGAAWVAVGLLRWASTPFPTRPSRTAPEDQPAAPT